MSKVIKNGTVVTHDLTYRADILIEGSKIVEIGKNLSGDSEIDATDCFVMPGGIDPQGTGSELILEITTLSSASVSSRTISVSPSLFNTRSLPSAPTSPSLTGNTNGFLFFCPGVSGQLCLKLRVYV